MKVNKTSNIDILKIKKYKDLFFGFYKVNQKFILDGFFEVEEKYYDEYLYSRDYRVIDGFLLVSKECKEIVEFYKNNFNYDDYDNEQNNKYFSNFICVELYQIDLGKNGKKLHLPCCCIGEDEMIIEYSNCTSIEINDDGDYLFKFGKSSLSPKREIKSTSFYIEGWDKLSVFEVDYFEIEFIKFDKIEKDNQVDYRISFEYSGKILTIYFLNIHDSNLCNNTVYYLMCIDKMLISKLYVNLGEGYYFICDKCYIESCE